MSETNFTVLTLNSFSLLLLSLWSPTRTQLFWLLCFLFRTSNYLHLKLTLRCLCENHYKRVPLKLAIRVQTCLQRELLLVVERLLKATELLGG